MNKPVAYKSEAGSKLCFVFLSVAYLGLLWCYLCKVPGVPWNAARLAPSYALNAGLPIYALPGEGAQLGWIYGPLLPELYRLTAMIPSITYAFLAAGVLNHLLLLVPAFVLLRGQGGSWPRTGALGLAYGILLLSTITAGDGYYFIHTDVPCIAMGLFSCFWLERHVRLGRALDLHVAVLFLVASVWFKQLGISLLPAMMLWLWREGRARVIPVFLRSFFLCSSLSVIVFFLLFGADRLLFNMVVFHLKRISVSPAEALQQTKDALFHSPLIWAGLPGAVLYWYRRGKVSPGPAFSRLSRLLFWCAFCTVPLGLSAAYKVAGTFSSLHAVHYLLLGFLLSLSASPGKRDPLWSSWRLLGVGSLVLSLSLAWSALAREGILFKPSSAQEEQLRVARENKGRLYMPWNPLVTIVTDERVYPFDDALMNLEAIGCGVPGDVVRGAVPPGAFIIYNEPSQSCFSLRYFQGVKGHRSGPSDFPQAP